MGVDPHARAVHLFGGKGAPGQVGAVIGRAAYHIRQQAVAFVIIINKCRGRASAVEAARSHGFPCQQFHLGVFLGVPGKAGGAVHEQIFERSAPGVGLKVDMQGPGLFQQARFQSRNLRTAQIPPESDNAHDQNHRGAEQ